MSNGRAAKRRKLNDREDAIQTTPTVVVLGQGKRQQSGKPKEPETQNDEVGNEFRKPPGRGRSSKPQDTPERAQLNVSSTEQNFEEDELPAIRSSGRQRKAPRRYSTEMLEGDTISGSPSTRIGEAPKKLKQPDSAASSNKKSSKKLSTLVSSQLVQLENGDLTTLLRPHTPSGGSARTNTKDTERWENGVGSSRGHMLRTSPSDLDGTSGRLKKIRKHLTTAAAHQNTHLIDEHRHLELEAEPEDELSMSRPDLTSPDHTPEVGLRNQSNTNKASSYSPIRISAPESHVKVLKSIVAQKLTGRRPIPLMGLEEEYVKVRQLIEQTVLAGEGNSMLLIGARGTGKTALVNKILSEIEGTDHEIFHVVRLNGFIHTDDKLALREIWRQLGREMEVEEESQSKNYADTLSTLLALLSHPSELSGNTSEHVSKSIIFIMDEFDLFTTHPRQTLLYNLFDIAQSRKAPIAVLGLTTRIDVAESLEKRVKSRFSHRHVHLSLPKTLAAFQANCKAALLLKPEEIGMDDRALMQQVAPQSGPWPKSTIDRDSLQSWNRSVETLFQTHTFSQHLKRIYYTSKSVPVALTSFLIPILNIDMKEASLDPNAFTLESSLEPPDSKLHILRSLPTLAIAILIAAARLDVILETNSCNFNMAYDEYCSLATKVKMQASAGGATGFGVGGKVWGKEIAKGAWEKLLDIGLLVPIIGPASGADMVRCDVALEEIEGSVPDLEKGMLKWCREI